MIRRAVLWVLGILIFVELQAFRAAVFTLVFFRIRKLRIMQRWADRIGFLLMAWMDAKR